MFTGIIEKVCFVESVSAVAGGKVVCVGLGELAEDVAIGDSVAVNGVCLTAVRVSGGSVCFDVSGETLEKSSLGGVGAGNLVNIERAMRADSRFGGHIVQGHVDGVAKVSGVERKGDFWRISVRVGGELLDQIVEKGSVALEGISLTVASIAGDELSVAVIPQTWENTNLSGKRVGDELNIETDIIAKIVAKQFEKAYGKKKESLTVDKLREMGF